MIDYKLTYVLGKITLSYSKQYLCQTQFASQIEN